MVFCGQGVQIMIEHHFIDGRVELIPTDKESNMTTRDFDLTQAFPKIILDLAAVDPTIAEWADDLMRNKGETEGAVRERLRTLMGIAQNVRPGDYSIPCTRMITAEEIGFLLCGEFEGNDMASWIGSAFQTTWTRPDGFDMPWYADEAFIASPGFQFTIQYDSDDDEEGDCTGEKIITRNDIVVGLTLMAEKYPDHWADLISESNADAVTYDVAMQCIVLGEVVYG
jgi:hypothetical protein